MLWKPRRTLEPRPLPQANGWLKLLLILTLTMAILLPSYHTMVRYTWIGRVLNGTRQRG